MCSKTKPSDTGRVVGLRLKAYQPIDFYSTLTPPARLSPGGVPPQAAMERRAKTAAPKSPHACEVAKELKREGWYAWDSNHDGIVSRIEHVRAKAGTLGT